MGSGSWTPASYNSYTTSTYGMSADTFATNNTFTAQSMYKSRTIAKELKPYNVMRECRDSEEHPETFPVILALDVTGSMGKAAVKVAQKLNEIMTNLYANEDIKDIEFCIMGIGDLAYDEAPIQISQFESDIRIAEQLDKIYFEAGGGGNSFESYSAAWYMGARHCQLDCWQRGKKGIIITMGDELPNPYLPKAGLSSETGDKLQADVDTTSLLAEASEKFDIYHISINDDATCYAIHNRKDKVLDEQWKKILGENYFISTLNKLSDVIIDIITNKVKGNITPTNICSVNLNDNNEIFW